MTPKNSRRQFTKSIFGWGTVTAISAGLFGAAVKKVPLQTALADSFREKSSADSIGKEYLATAGAKENAESILKSLAAAVRLPADKHVSVESLRPLLKRRIRADFRSGNTVELKGWVVSRTEAQVCALVTLEQSTVRFLGAEVPL